MIEANEHLLLFRLSINTHLVSRAFEVYATLLLESKKNIIPVPNSHPSLIGYTSYADRVLPIIDTLSLIEPKDGETLNSISEAIVIKNTNDQQLYGFAVSEVLGTIRYKDAMNLKSANIDETRLIHYEDQEYEVIQFDDLFNSGSFKSMLGEKAL